jgi:hypothetical protein
MWKAIAFSFAGICVLTTVFDVAFRALGSLSMSQVSVGSGLFLVVLALSPLFMKPSDADLNDIGLAPMDDEESSPLRLENRGQMTGRAM